MLNIVQQVINHFVTTWKKINIIDLKIEDKTLMSEKMCCFVTVFLNWEVRWSAWNIKELKDNAIEELIENTIAAISKDERFSPLTEKEANGLKIRIDKITERNLLKTKFLKDVDPTKSGIIAIKNDYEKMACILPDINPKLILGEDFVNVLKEKLQDKDFSEKNYILYEIKTEIITNF